MRWFSFSPFPVVLSQLPAYLCALSQLQSFPSPVSCQAVLSCSREMMVSAEVSLCGINCKAPYEFQGKQYSVLTCPGWFGSWFIFLVGNGWLYALCSHLHTPPASHPTPVPAGCASPAHLLRGLQSFSSSQAAPQCQGMGKKCSCTKADRGWMARKMHFPHKSVLKPGDMALRGGGNVCRMAKHASAPCWP